MKTGSKPVSRHDNCMSNYFVSDKVHTVHTNVGNGLRAVPSAWYFAFGPYFRKYGVSERHPGRSLQYCFLMVSTNL